LLAVVPVLAAAAAIKHCKQGRSSYENKAFLSLQ